MTVVGTHPQIVGIDVVYRLTEDARSIAFERACSEPKSTPTCVPASHGCATKPRQ